MQIVKENLDIDVILNKKIKYIEVFKYQEKRKFLLKPKQWHN